MKQSRRRSGSTWYHVLWLSDEVDLAAMATRLTGRHHGSGTRGVTRSWRLMSRRWLPTVAVACPTSHRLYVNQGHRLYPRFTKLTPQAPGESLLGAPGRSYALMQPGMRALDVGSGTWYLTACFALMVELQGRVVGLEHIPKLVASSTENIKKNAAAP